MLFEGVNNRGLIIGLAAAAGIVLLVACFIYVLRPVDAESAEPIAFEVKPGDHFREIVSRLAAADLIRSRTAFGVLSLLTGSLTRLKPGVYELNQSMKSGEILEELVSGIHREVQLTIREGISIYEIDKLLSYARVVPSGSIIAAGSSQKLEGRLFPDTYKFFAGSKVEDIINKFLASFMLKAEPILKAGRDSAEANLILASIVQNEVPDFEDQKVVAGILKKRLEAKIPLQVDATICYIKKAASSFSPGACYPLTPLDFKVDSPYNTYLYKGLPPGPIGNPGIQAITAVLNWKETPYWFYLSDPLTHKTKFSKTLDEHERNRVKYLRSKK